MEPHAEPQLHGKEFWESHYGQAGRVWSGNVNPTLAGIVEHFTPGTALDLGCGEGADALWLASRGWQATGVDISQTAVARAMDAARQTGTGPGTAEFLQADLAEWTTGRSFDLVTLSFFHAPFEFQRIDILGRAMRALAPGGHLVVLSHGSHPAGRQPADDAHEHDHGRQHGPQLVTVDSELRSLGVPADGYQVLQASTVNRAITGPDGRPTSIRDVVVVLRRDGAAPQAR